MLSLVHCVDSFQRMLVGYFNEQGILIYHPASTAAHYLKGAFITDLLGCLALENLETAQIEFSKPGYQFLKTFFSFITIVLKTTAAPR